MKTFLFFISFIIIYSSFVFAGDPKVYTDADLNQYKSDDTEETYEYNKKIIQGNRDKEAEAKKIEADAKKREECNNLAREINSTVPSSATIGGLTGAAIKINQLQNRYYNKCLSKEEAQAARQRDSQNSRPLIDIHKEYQNTQRDQKIDAIHDKIMRW